MFVVVAGDDQMAARIAEALMLDHSVIVVGNEAQLGTSTERLDVEVVFGAITSPRVLEQARVDRAEAFIACTTNDEENIVACLAAKRRGKARTVCLLNGAGFLEDEEEQDVSEALGIDVVVRPAQQLATEIVRIVTVPGALDVEVFADGSIALLRIAVDEGAALTSAPLKSLKLPKQALIVALRRGEELVMPKGGTRIEAGDRLIVMGRWAPLQELVAAAHIAPKSRARRQAAVIGAGTVGVEVARGLEAAKWRVKLIESDLGRCEVVADELDSLVLHGDGADLTLLEEERIGDMPVVVAVTNNDEKNLLISLLAKQLGVERIVTRADKLSNELMFEKVGIDVVRSSRGAAIRSVTRSLEKTEFEIRAVLEHGDASVIEVTLPTDFDARLLRDIRLPTTAVIGAILRGRQSLVPGGNDTLRAGDRLLIFCYHGDEEATRDYFLTHTHSSHSERVRVSDAEVRSD